MLLREDCPVGLLQTKYLIVPNVVNAVVHLSATIIAENNIIINISIHLTFVRHRFLTLNQIVR